MIFCNILILTGIIFIRARGKLKEKSDRMSGFSYKQQFAVVVICKDEKEQEKVYNELKEKGHNLKVVSV